MYCNIRDMKINYEIHGSGKPLLILNSFGTDMRSMIYCMEPLFTNREGWRRIYVDQPGVGGTEASDWIESTDDMLDIILEFVDAVLPGEKYSIAGRSYGGYLAIGMLNKRFDSIDGLALICPGMFIVNEKRDIEDDLQEVINLDPEVEKRIGERVRTELAEASTAADKEFQDKLRKKLEFSFRVDEFDKPFMKPALIMTGRQDDVTGYRDAFKLMKYFHRATFCTLDKAGHIPQIEQEGLFNELVGEWLDRVYEEISRQ